MKQTITLLLIIMLSVFAKAQDVNIPDPNFHTALVNNPPVFRTGTPIFRSKITGADSVVLH